MTERLTAEKLRAVMNYDPATGVFTWLVDIGTARAGAAAGGVSSKGYIQIGFAHRGYPAHRLAWLYVHGVWPTHVIDHINGIKTDNRIANLRDVPQILNLQNQRRASGKNRTSELLGVWRAHKSDRWVSRIVVEGKRIHLGYFDTEQEGHEAYVAAKRRLHKGCTL